MRQKLVGAILGLGLMFGVSAGAWADMLTINITVGNASISGMGPFGTLVINRTSTTMATLTFTSALPDLFTDGSSVAVNLNLTAGILSGLTGDCPSCTYSVAQFQNVNGFGNFSLAIDSGNSGPNGRSHTISFTVTSTAGPAWNTAADVLTPNTAGNEVAAHICVKNAVSDTGCAVTGFATQTGGVEQEGPEPGILSLLGIGIFALGFTAIRRRA
jgi:hypothetical protein